MFFVLTDPRDAIFSQNYILFTEYFYKYPLQKDSALCYDFVNNEVKDSIYVRDESFWDSMTISLASLSFYGNLFYWAYVNSIDPDKWKIKLTPNVRPLSFPSFGEFVDEKKKLISY